MPSYLLFALILLFAFPVHAEQTRIIALGDSLTAGYGLQSGEDFATKLQEALISDGMDVKVENAGVSGDTSAGGLARLEWAIQGASAPDLVMVALGANDMLRGINPSVTRQNLEEILKTLKDKKIPVLLIGMKSATNMGEGYRKEFEVIYPELADQYGVPLYPFFLEGVAMDATLNLEDGMHPNTKGVLIMVQNIKPSVKEALEK